MTATIDGFPWNVRKASLNPAIKRHIKSKEKELGRTCRTIWEHENPQGEKYLFASFCRNWNRLIVTVGWKSPHLNAWLVPR